MIRATLTTTIDNALLEKLQDTAVSENLAGVNAIIEQALRFYFDEGIKLQKATEKQYILSCLEQMGKQSRVSTLISILQGFSTKDIRSLSYDKLPTFGVMRGYLKENLTKMIEALVAEGCLYDTQGKYFTVRLKE